MHKSLLFALATAVSAAACVPAATPIPIRPLDARADSSEYRAYLQGGTGEIAGQAFLTTRGGDVKLAAGRVVTLDPATTYAREWFPRFGVDLMRFDAPAHDPLFQSARRTTTANAEGRFRFQNLASGDYIVRTTVTWETGAAYGSRQGGVVASLVAVKPGPSAEIVLNQVYTPDVAATLGLREVTGSELAARPHRVLGRVSGRSCQVGGADAAPSEEAARINLTVNAAKMNAAGVSSVSCQKHGMSMKPNCWRRIDCDADAIAWGA